MPWLDYQVSILKDQWIIGFITWQLSVYNKTQATWDKTTLFLYSKIQPICSKLFDCNVI